MTRFIMKKNLLLSFCALIVFTLSINAEVAQNEHPVLQEKLNINPDLNKKKLYKKHPKTISFYFDNEDMIDIINFLAAEKEVNVILPVGANAINVKVTLHLEEKISVDEAWDILYTLLDIAGYSMVAKDDTYNIVKTTTDINREALPLYIVKPEEIPNTDKRIRYLYYFSNIKISDDKNPNNNEILAILNSVLPPPASGTGGTPAPGGVSFYTPDAATNSLLISDKANNIKAVMNIITALDTADAQEKPEIIQLRYMSAKKIEDLFKDLLQTAGDANQIRLGIRQPNNNTFFKKVRIVADERTNRIIVFGRPQAVQRVKDFINSYIDVELESGKSILHVYQLQYLDAEKFAPVLEKIVKNEKVGATEQSKAGATTAGGTERFFEGVIIREDKPTTISGEQPSGISQGNNNLIIAARNDDYERIKKLIEQLDIPQPQVIIEVLIADLTIDDIASLGSNVRNPLGMGLPDKVNFQAAMTSDFLTNQVTNPTTIQADLLRRAFNQDGTITADCDNIGSNTQPACFSAANFFNQGTMLLSFNDAATGQTWGLTQVRKFIDASKVLHHPHLIATHNKEAEIVLREERLANDQGSGSSGGTTSRTRKWIPAALSVKITPRISSAEMVNLQVIIDIQQFETPPQSFTNTGPQAANTANKITRNVTTNANVRSGHILALGGLTRVDTVIEQLETPLLGRIPLIGWLFKDRTNTTNKSNLTVFISPTIIEPRIRGGVGNYTKNHVQLVKSYAREGMLFDNLQDPITRWFFKTQKDDAEVDLDDFLAQDEFIAPTIFDTRAENRVIAEKVKAQAPVITASAPKAVEKKQTVVIAAPSKKVDIPVALPSQTPTVVAQPKEQDLKSLMADVDNPFEKKGA